MINQQYPFKLPPLSYGYNDLEPFINGEIIKIHHRVLMQNYVNKRMLNIIVGYSILMKKMAKRH